MKLIQGLSTLALVVLAVRCGSKDQDTKTDDAAKGRGSYGASSPRQVLSCETKVADVRNQDGAVVSGPTFCIAYEGSAFQSSATELKQKCEVAQSDSHVSSTFFERGCDMNSYTNKCTVKGSATDQAISNYYNSRVLSAQEMQAAKASCAKNHGDWYNF